MNFAFDLHPIIQFLHQHPHSVGFFTFFTVFCEAMAVIGVIVPGSVTMTAIGILIGSNVIPAGNTFAWAIAGAICGDELSYLLGVYYQDRLHRIWPFKKHPQLLEKSENFFKRHGGKSVFIGRFFGPMRAMVPMVAGMLKMKQGRFLVAAIPSAAIWAVGYMLPGVLLGALSLELPPKVATKFILGILLFIAIAWFVIWVLENFAKEIYRELDRYTMKLWLFLQRHPTLHWISALLADPREPENHKQLFLLFLAILLALALHWVFQSALNQGALTILNTPTYYLLSSLRTIFGDRIMIAFTVLGEGIVLIPAAVILALWLILKRYWYIAFHWLMAIIFSSSSVLIFKHLWFLHRPGGELNFDHTSSFPSGHVTLSFTLLGLWSVIVARELPRGRGWLPYSVNGFIILGIIISRLYLGAHWVTDVIGGLLLGSFLTLILTISYRRKHTRRFPLRSFVTTSILALSIIGGGYFVYAYPEMMQNYSLKWPANAITLSSWQNEIGKTIPLYRLNRLGKPIQAFNIQWLGDINKIEQALTKHGWVKQQTHLGMQDILARLVSTTTVGHLPLLPQLYRDKPLVLLMTKTTGQDNTALVLRLWQSDISISNSPLPLWLGVVDYHQVDHSFLRLPFSKKNGNHRKFVGAAKTLGGYMEDFEWQMITLKKENLPQEMQDLNWDGQIFIVKPKRG